MAHSLPDAVDDVDAGGVVVDQRCQAVEDAAENTRGAIRVARQTKRVDHDAGSLHRGGIDFGRRLTCRRPGFNGFHDLILSRSRRSLREVHGRLSVFFVVSVAQW